MKSISILVIWMNFIYKLNMIIVCICQQNKIMHACDSISEFNGIPLNCYPTNRNYKIVLSMALSLFMS